MLGNWILDQGSCLFFPCTTKTQVIQVHKVTQIHTMMFTIEGCIALDFPPLRVMTFNEVRSISMTVALRLVLAANHSCFLHDGGLSMFDAHL